MKKSIIKILLGFIFAALIVAGCKKDEVKPDPTGAFIQAEGYTSTDVTMASGDTILVGLNFKWNGSDALTTLHFYVNDVMLDRAEIIPSEYGQDFIYGLKLTKSQLETEKWDFQVTDAGGKTATLTLTLTKDATGGAIKSVEGITLGAQDNTTVNGFYAISNGSIYSFADAETNSEIIDLVCAFDDVVENSNPKDNETFLTSAGSNLSDIYNFDNWQTTNTTLFNSTTLSADQFNYVDSDKLIVSSFNETENEKKAKNLRAGDVYAFKTEAGKYGLIKVTASTYTNAVEGQVTFDIKIQE